MFDREHLRLLLLKLIEAAPQHGYELIRSLEDRSGGRYAPSPGVIYPTLSMLADEGLIVEQATDDARRRYAITPEGAKVLADQAETLAMIDARLEELARSAKKERPPQIERAAANLSMALRQRMQQGASDDLAHDIAAILDDAARRIERL